MRAMLNGAWLGYDDEGSGAALLLIHAGIADRSMWNAQARAFSATHRVIRPDLRGFGESELPGTPFALHEDMRALLDALGVERASVVGISMGGNVALELALAHPARVERLALVSTLAAMDEPSEALRQVWRESEAAFEQGDLERATEIEVGAWLIGRGRTAAELDQGYLTRGRALVRGVWERALTAEEPGEELEPEAPASERLGEPRMPVLLARGDRDLPDVEVSMAALAAGIPHARVEVIPNTAHLPPLERPEAFNELLRSFLAV